MVCEGWSVGCRECRMLQLGWTRSGGGVKAQNNLNLKTIFVLLLKLLGTGESKH